MPETRTPKEQILSDTRNMCWLMVVLGMSVAMFLSGMQIGELYTGRARADLAILRKQAIEHGFARYHPQTGHWEWIIPAEQKAE